MFPIKAHIRQEIGGKYVRTRAWWGGGWGHLEGGLELGLLGGERIREGFGLGGAFAALGLPHTLGSLRRKERTGTTS